MSNGPSPIHLHCQCQSTLCWGILRVSASLFLLASPLIIFHFVTSFIMIKFLLLYKDEIEVQGLQVAGRLITAALGGSKLNSLLEVEVEVEVERENIGFCNVDNNGNGKDGSCFSSESGYIVYDRKGQHTDIVKKTISSETDFSNKILSDTPTDLMWHNWFSENDDYNLLFELKNAEKFSINEIADKKVETSKNIFYRLLYLAGLNQSKFTEINNEIIIKKNLRLEMRKTEELSLMSTMINKFYEKDKNEKYFGKVEKSENEEIIGMESIIKMNRVEKCALATSYYFPAAQNVAAHMEPELSNDRTGLKILHEMIFYWRDLEGHYYSPPNDAKKGYYSSRSNEQSNGSDDILSEDKDEDKKAEDDYFHEYPGEKKEARYQRKLAEAVGG